MSLTLKESKSASHGKHLKLLSLIEKGTHRELLTSETELLSNAPILEDRADKIRVWKEFPRQSQAIEFIKMCRYNVGVFSFESEKFGTSGQRHFIVSAYHTFVHRYLDSLIPNCEPNKPHFYEVIVEGTVCRLYFDIEYQKLINPLVNGVKLLDTFIQYVNFCLFYFYGVVCDRRHIVDLDSSSERKFSRHLIYHIPNAVFHSNKEAGRFVLFICDELRCLKSSDSFRVLLPMEPANKLASWRSDVICPDKASLLQLFVLNDKDCQVLICDEGVYSKNRNFRLYGSSKLGKDIDLKLAHENKFIPESGLETHNLTKLSKSKHVTILFDSLIAYIPFDHNLRILIFDHPISPESKPTHLPSDTNNELPPIECQDSSPYPPLDAFIRSLITRDGAPGRIRRVTYFPEGKFVIFDITGYRYCENIQRHHRSNNIMLLANLDKLTYYQKCYDPDCKRIQFKSSEMPLPAKLVSECFSQPEDEFKDLDMEKFESDFDNDIGDEEWGRISEEMETSVTYVAEP